MPCTQLKDKDGRIVGIVCSRTRKCHVCGKPSTKLCDVCDLPMCEEHSHRVTLDTDVCEHHNNETYIIQAIENRKQMEKM